MMMDIVEKSWKTQRSIEERFRHIGKGKYGRVLKMARRPSSEEYIKVIEITGIGLVAIGALGFLIMWIMTYLPRYF